MNDSYLSGWLSAIVSSKMFRASSRKDKIFAALNNPIHEELIAQLTEYLDDEYQPKKEEEKEDNTEIMDDDFSFENEEPPAPLTPVEVNVNNQPSLAARYGNALDEEGAAKFDATQMDVPQEEAPEEAAAPAAPEAAAKVHKAPITAEAAAIPLIENQVPLAGLSGELKGTLNARDSTKGVTRVAVKKDEVWIYYEDSVNLNHVMTSVIDILTASGYTFLIFNRLARTDNAMVFAISSNDTIAAIGDRAQ